MKWNGAAVILGAGASKGAHVAGGRTPPLDGEFLDAAADHFSGKRARGPFRNSVTAWNAFKASLSSAGLDFRLVRRWRLEQLSTFLEARASLKGLQLGRGRPREYSRALEALKIAVCHVLDAEGGSRPCALHKTLFQTISPSAVVTFNYDLIADQSLLSIGRLNWRSVQYRCATSARVPRDNGRSAYVRIRSQTMDSAVPLLKLHGSMHYSKLDRGSGFRLSGTMLPSDDSKLFNYVEVPDKPFLIPPVAAKIDIRQPALRKRWYDAVDYLHNAPSWIFWGYSFPQTDTISHVLFRTALARNRKPKPIVVVDPDVSVRHRVKEVCQKVSVQHFTSMEGFLMQQGAIVVKDGQS